MSARPSAAPGVGLARGAAIGGLVLASLACSILIVLCVLGGVLYDKGSRVLRRAGEDTLPQLVSTTASLLQLAATRARGNDAAGASTSPEEDQDASGVST